MWDGASWSASPMNISGTPLTSFAASIAADGSGGLHAVWNESTPEFIWQAFYSSKVSAFSASGRVSDSSGTGISGATVSDDAGHAVTTESDGDYVLGDLYPGVYRLTPSKQGYIFQPTVSDPISVPPNSTGIDFAGIPCQAPSGLDICHLERGDILLSHQPGLVTWLSKLGGSYWVHSGIYAGAGKVVEAEGCEDGVVIRSVVSGNFWPESNSWAVLRTVEDEVKREAATAYAAEQKDDPYNMDFLFAGIPPELLWCDCPHRITTRDTDDCFYCNQLVWRAYSLQDLDLDSNSGYLAECCQDPSCESKLPSDYRTACPALLDAITGDDLYFSDKVAIVDEREFMLGRPLKEVVILALSPVDLLITDPEGRRTGVDPQSGDILMEIPGLSYSGPDAEPEFVGIPSMYGTWGVKLIGREEGVYTLVTEVVDPDYHETHASTGAVAPGDIIDYEATYPTVPGGPITLTREVDIVIKPGSSPNCFNNNGHGVIPVAVLSTETFDAATVDAFSVALDGMGVRAKGKSGDAGALEDVDADGDLDLVVHIEDIDGTYQEGDTLAMLTAETVDGVQIRGTDTICIMP